MRWRLLVAAGALAATLSGTAQAGMHAEALGRCAVETTSAADRNALLRWMFITVSGNPGLRDLTSITAEVRAENLRAVGALFNRIMLTACRREAVTALRHEGNAGIQGGFEALGRLAAMEMMMTPSAMSSMAELDRHVDQAGLEALAEEAAARPGV